MAGEINEKYELNDDKGLYNLYLPQASIDHIQKSIVAAKSPYEFELLKATIPWLEDGTNVLDVGSNIGNHAIYWARHGHFVHLVEPNSELMNIARRNFQINTLEDSAEFHEIALGASESHGYLTEVSASNSGAGQIVLDANGPVPITTVDILSIENLALIKIDVEGMDVDVLRGARETLASQRPIVVIETLTDEALVEAARILNENKYLHWSTHNASPTHIFIPLEKLSIAHLQDRATRAARLEFEARAQKDKDAAKIREINLRYRYAMQHERELKERLSYSGQETKPSNVEDGEDNQTISSMAPGDTVQIARDSLASIQTRIELLIEESRSVNEHAINTARVQEGLRSELDALVFENKRLEEACLQAAATTKEYELVKSEALAQAKIIKNELETLKMDQEAKEKDLAAQLKLTEESIKEVNDLRRDLGTERALRSRAEEATGRLEEELNQLKEKLQQLAVLRSDSLVEIDSMVKRLGEYQAKLADQEQAVTSARNENEELRASLDKAKEELRSLQEVAKKARSERKDISEKFRDRGVQLAKQMEVTREKSSRLIEQQGHLKDAKSEISRLHAEKIRLAERIAILGRERDAAKKTLVELRRSRSYRFAKALNGTIKAPFAAIASPSVPTLELEPGRNETAANGRVGSRQPSYVEPKAIKSNSDQVRGALKSFITIACILDEFSYECFAPEANLVQLTPTAWEEQLELAHPDVLFVESAWRGHENTWTNMVGKAGKEILEIVAWCNAREIPTVFWNKEDPVHFATFLRVASYFDVVMTTDIDCVPRYRSHLGHDRVYFLPFAAQTRMHNPIEEYERIDEIAFAGAYYSKYKERTKDLEEFVEYLPAVKPLTIFDRMYGQDNPDYQFPDKYEPYIVGNLAPSEIAIAYKGYGAGLNLNSVKHSQSMMARRVFELIASNTLVVSNYSPALKIFFGDLVIATDSGALAADRLRRLESTPDGTARMRSAALRQVLREHTYADRVETICKAVGLDYVSEVHSMAVIILESSADDNAAVLETIKGQSIKPDAIYSLKQLQGDNDQDENIQTISLELPEAISQLGKILEAHSHLAFFHEADYYGPHFLEDLILTWRYANVDVVTKELTGTRVSGKKSRNYRTVKTAEIRSSAIRLDSIDVDTLFRLLKKQKFSRRGQLVKFKIDDLEYIKNGAKSVPVDSKGPRSELSAKPFTLKELNQISSNVTKRQRINNHSISVDQLRHLIKGMTGKVTVIWEEGSFAIRSELEAGSHGYGYFPSTISLEDLGWSDVGHFYLDSSLGLDIQVAIIFHDANGKRLGHAMAYANRNHSFAIPDLTTRIKFGIRASGPGQSVLRGMYASPYQEPNAGLITRTKNIVLTNIYPSYGDLYRNGFVHSRVSAYRQEGLDVEVVTLDQVAAPQSREFEGVRVSTLNQADLGSSLSQGNFESVLVHFLNPAMWHSISMSPPETRVIVWIHGSEIQPWWRREYNAVTEEALNTLKKESDERLNFWRKVFAERRPNTHFVFVSNYFAEEVFEDVGIRLPQEAYHIIHNPIDGELFDYIPKPDYQRKKILSIRPYASRKYANDLSVNAVIELSRHPNFKDLEFKFIGDGVLFEETLKPVWDMSNVQIERRFLTHSEMANVHKEYGIFLTPTRMDAQGVSRDEAMSSGLVPITSGVTAVPEFVDESCGVLAPLDDFVSLAEGILAISEDAERFQEMSRRAAARVRAQSGKKQIINRELDLILGRKVERSISE
ncbi:FkbM family methyltransferase [Gulosibacter molinativorax]|nr:FkbM family methyltransferase [Gulosibacter molinativorax]QUY62748.1 AcbIV [Gulosibacter molinativorax]